MTHQAPCVGVIQLLAEPVRVRTCLLTIIDQQFSATSRRRPQHKRSQRRIFRVSFHCRLNRIRFTRVVFATAKNLDSLYPELFGVDGIPDTPTQTRHPRHATPDTPTQTTHPDTPPDTPTPDTPTPDTPTPDTPRQRPDTPQHAHPTPTPDTPRIKPPRHALPDTPPRPQTRPPDTPTRHAPPPQTRPPQTRPQTRPPDTPTRPPHALPRHAHPDTPHPQTRHDTHPKPPQTTRRPSNSGLLAAASGWVQ
nr:extensin-like [Penaeus vannamei]